MNVQDTVTELPRGITCIKKMRERERERERETQYDKQKSLSPFGGERWCFLSKQKQKEEKVERMDNYIF